MSGFPPPPPGTDLSANRTPSLIAASAVTFVFAFSGLLLRFVTRYCSGAGFWLDDWLMLPAFVMVTGIVALTSKIDYSFGHHVWEIGYEAQVLALEYALADEVCYNLVLLFTKLSVLALYWRVFHITKLRIPIILMSVIVTAWGIASVITTVLECDPVEKGWNVALPGTCINIKSLYLGNSITNILTDAIILSMPMHPIFKIHRPLPERIMIAGMFLCGGLIIVVSCLRLNYLTLIDLTSIDLVWNYTDVFIWSAVEVNIAVFSACLPTLRPFYRFLRSGSFQDPASRAASSAKASGSFGDTPGPRSMRSSQKQRESSTSGEEV